MRNAYSKSEIEKRLKKSPLHKIKIQTKLQNMLIQHKPFEKQDLILIDSSIINFYSFLEKTDFKWFEEYSTKGLQQITNLTQSYFDLFQNKKTTVTKKVHSELEDLLKLMNFRIQRASIASKKRTNKKSFRYRINNIEKAKTNKQLYEEIRNTVYKIIKISKRDQIKPSQTDQVLFEIIQKISNERTLKQNNLNGSHKEHDFESTTDEWLVTQAYNKILFNQKNVALFSNDKDIGRILIDVSYYLRSPFIKRKTTYPSKIINKKPLILANPKLDIYTPQLTKKHYEILGYLPGTKEEWHEIYKKIKPAQNEFIKLMQHQEKLYLKQLKTKSKLI